MPFSLNLYHDQVGADGSTASPLPPAHRLLYVRHGRLVINGRGTSADEAVYCGEPLALQSAGKWSQVWRWELAPPNLPPQLHEGAGVLSSLRMSRVVTSLAMLEGHALAVPARPHHHRRRPHRRSPSASGTWHSLPVGGRI